MSILAAGWGLALAAEPCAPVTLAADDLTGVAVWAPAGAVTIAPGADGEVRAEACGDLRVKLVREDGVVTVRRRGAGEGTLTVHVPASIAALSVFRPDGPVAVRDLPARVAVVSGAGPIEVARVGALRVQAVAGDLRADAIAGDLVVQGLTGSLVAREVGGAVDVTGVTGTVDVAEAAVAGR